MQNQRRVFFLKNILNALNIILIIEKSIFIFAVNIILTLMKNVNFLLSLTALSICASCTKDFAEDYLPTSKNDVLRQTEEYYYWAGDTKVQVTPLPERSYILFTGTDRYELVNPSEMDYSVFKTAKITDNQMFHKGLTRATDMGNVSWVIGSTRAFDLENDGILYKGHGYKCVNGPNFFASHLFYVKLKNAEDYPALERLAQENNVEILGSVEYLDLWYRMACTSLSDCDALHMSAKFYESGLVRYSEPDIMFGIRSCGKQPNSYPEFQMATGTAPAAAPNDPLFSQQWYLHNPGGLDINYLEAKNITQGDSNITVLIIDPENIAENHPDLPELTYNVYYAPGTDDVHGTNCAGIISARTDNGVGIAGIAPNCKLAFHYHNGRLGLNYESVINTLVNATLNSNADVVSCSWEWYFEDGGGDYSGSDGGSDTEDIPFFQAKMMFTEAFNYIRQCGSWHYDESRDLGTVVIFAAGNNNSSSPSGVASYADIAVSAIKKNGALKEWCNEASIVAPGDSILTTTQWFDIEGTTPYPAQTYYRNDFSHTSAACPQVAAVAALILSINPDLTHNEVARYIRNTATQLPTGCYNGKLLNAGAALQAVLNDM